MHIFELSKNAKVVNASVKGAIADIKVNECIVVRRRNCQIMFHRSQTLCMIQGKLFVMHRSDQPKYV